MFHQFDISPNQCFIHITYYTWLVHTKHISPFLTNGFQVPAPSDSFPTFRWAYLPTHKSKCSFFVYKMIHDPAVAFPNFVCKFYCLKLDTYLIIEVSFSKSKNAYCLLVMVIIFCFIYFWKKSPQLMKIIVAYRDPLFHIHFMKDQISTNGVQKLPPILVSLAVSKYSEKSLQN
jgi:hypothetical protein